MVQLKHALSVLIVVVALARADQSREQGGNFGGRGGRYANGQGGWTYGGSNGERDDGWTNSKGGSDGGATDQSTESNGWLNNGVNDESNDGASSAPSVVLPAVFNGQGSDRTDAQFDGLNLNNGMPFTVSETASDFLSEWPSGLNDGLYNEWNSGVPPSVMTGQRNQWKNELGDGFNNGGDMNLNGGSNNGVPSTVAAAAPSGQMVGWDTGSNIYGNSGANSGWWPSNDWYHAQGNMGGMRTINGPRNEWESGRMRIADRASEGGNNGQNDGWWPSNDWYYNQARIARNHQWGGDRDGGSRFSRWW